MSDLFEEDLDAARLIANTTLIASEVRSSGEEGERHIAEWVTDRLREYGLKAQLTEHDALISLPGDATCSLVGQGEDLPCITHSFAAPTGPDGLEGAVVYAHDLSEVRAERVAGKIVLIEGLASPMAAQAAAAAGALAHVHISPSHHLHEMILSPVWGSAGASERGELPMLTAISITRAAGARLKDILRHSEARLRICAEVDTRWKKIPLIVGEVRGAVEPDKYVLLSGHIDSWHYGAMDNASGNALMLEVGRLAARHRGELRRSLRVVFWSGHSHGRYAGSAWYADEHWDDLDENCIVHVYAESPGAQGAVILDAGRAHREAVGVVSDVVAEVTGQEFLGTSMFRAGDESFWPIGIPSVHYEAHQSVDGEGYNPSGHLLGAAKSKANGYGWWWHTPEDTVDKIDPANLLRDTRVIAGITWRFLTDEALPFDYHDVATEVAVIVSQLQAKSAPHLDLESCIQSASDLVCATSRLNKCLAEIAEMPAGPDREHALAAANACQLSLARILVPALYTRRGRFAQDPALPIQLIPALADAARIGDLGADDVKHLLVDLRRGRNSVRDALRRAVAEIDRTVGSVNGKAD